MAICRTCYRRDCTKHPQTDTLPRLARTGWWRSLTSKIETVEQADKALREVAITLYVFGGILLLGALLVFTPVHLFDTFFLVLMGFVLRRSRSRAVALLVTGYALLSAFVTVLTYLGQYSGLGRNVFLVALLLAAAFRGVYATFAYHRLQRTRVNFAGIVLLSTVSIVLSAIAFFLTPLIAWYAGVANFEQQSDEALGIWFLVCVAISWFLGFGRVLPLIRQIRVVKTSGPLSSPIEEPKLKAA